MQRKEIIEFSFTEIGILLAIANICDAVSTYYALKYVKNVIEANYYMAAIIAISWSYYFAVKIASSLVFALAAIAADKIAKHWRVPETVKTVCKSFMGALTLLFAYLSLHNFMLIFPVR